MKTKNKSYCYKCDDDVEYIVKKITTDSPIGGVKLKRTYKAAFCKKCGTPVPVEKLDYAANKQGLDMFKSHQHLLTSKQIKEIRIKRGLTQTELANMLGLGEKTITRYENGQIQDKAYDILLRIIGDDNGYNLVKKITDNNSNNKNHISYESVMKDIKKYVSFMNKQNEDINIKKIIVKTKDKNGFKLKELIIN